MGKETIEMSGKSRHGGARKGAGRKSKAEKLLIAGFSAPWFDAETQKIKLRQLLDSEDEKVVADITKYLLNRIYGMPPQDVTLGGKGKDGSIPLELINDL